MQRRDGGRRRKGSGKPQKSFEHFRPDGLPEAAARGGWHAGHSPGGQEAETQAQRNPLYLRSSGQAQAEPLQPPSEEKEHPFIKGPKR